MSARPAVPEPDPTHTGEDASPGIRTRRRSLRSAYRVVREKAGPQAARPDTAPRSTPAHDDRGHATAPSSGGSSARERMLALAAAACGGPGASSSGTYGAYASFGRGAHLTEVCGRQAADVVVRTVALAPSHAITAQRDGVPYRILVVEDDPDLLAILRAAAELHGHEVIAASDGAQALEAIRTLQPDLVLLDLMLPVVDGYHVLSSIRAHSQVRDVPVVVVSARASDGERALGLSLGATEYVTKPYDVRALMGRVESWMDHETVAPPTSRLAQSGGTSARVRFRRTRAAAWGWRARGARGRVARMAAARVAADRVRPS